MRVQLEGQTKKELSHHAGVNWGIAVVKVNIAGIKFDQNVTEDLELKRRKELQREGQKVEIQHFADRVQELMAPYPKGPGLTREQAIEQVQLSLGLLKKETKAQAFSLDPATAAMVAAILDGRK